MAANLFAEDVASKAQIATINLLDVGNGDGHSGGPAVLT